MLVNNVEAMFEDHPELGGVEASFVVNYLLTELLLPALKSKSAESCGQRDDTSSRARQEDLR